MNKNNFCLRPAIMDDCRRIFDIRNAEQVRRNSFDKNIINFAAHQKWYKNSLANKQRHLLVLTGSDGIAGVLRFDISGASAEVSLYLAPEYFGLGLGAQMLADGQVWLKPRRPEIKKLSAKILADNAASKSLFAKCGFHERQGIWSKEI